MVIFRALFCERTAPGDSDLRVRSLAGPWRRRRRRVLDLLARIVRAPLQGCICPPTYKLRRGPRTKLRHDFSILHGQITNSYLTCTNGALEPPAASTGPFPHRKGVSALRAEAFPPWTFAGALQSALPAIVCLSMHAPSDCRFSDPCLHPSWTRPVGQGSLRQCGGREVNRVGGAVETRPCLQYAFRSFW